MEKQWYRVTPHMGGIVGLWELTQDEANAGVEDWDFEPMVVMTKEEYDKARQEAYDIGYDLGYNAALFEDTEEKVE
jgi:hypothetical protein